MSTGVTYFRMKVPLPLQVDGGITRWKLYLHYHGKHATQCEFLAENLSSRQMIKIFDGRSVDHSPYDEFPVMQGTMAHRIFSKLVRERRAEVTRALVKDPLRTFGTGGTDRSRAARGGY